MSQSPFHWLTPQVRSVVISSLVARLPKGMVPLATILLVSQRTGSFLIAGTVAGMVALSDAITTPVLGRLVDRLGLIRVVLPAAAVHVLGTVTLLTTARGGEALVGAVVAACLIGIGNPPISACMKTVWPRLVGEHDLPTAYRVESLVQQLIFLAGPLLVAAIRAPGFALALSAVLLAAGSLWFVLAAPIPVHGPQQSGRRRGALHAAGVRTLIAATILQGVAFGAAPVGFTSFASASRTPSLAGALQAALTLGGLLGTFAPMRVTDGQRYVRMLSGFALALVPVAATAATPSPPATAVMALFLAIAGLFLTPVAAASYVLLQQATDPGTRTEAFAWLSTGLAGGSAAGAALAGLLSDHVGTLPALAMLPTAVAIAAVLSHYRLTSL